MRKSNWLLPALFASMLLVELAAALCVLLTADQDTVFFQGRPDSRRLLLQTAIRRTLPGWPVEYRAAW